DPRRDWGLHQRLSARLWLVTWRLASATRALTATVAVLAVAIAGAGCGSDSGESGAGDASPADVQALLSGAFKATKAVDSGDLEVRAKADVNGVASLQDPVELRIGGPFKS